MFSLVGVTEITMTTVFHTVSRFKPSIAELCFFKVVPSLNQQHLFELGIHEKLLSIILAKNTGSLYSFLI